MISKVMNAVLLALLGIVVGTVGTVAQQATWTLGSAVIPWGVVGALLAVACLFIGLRVVNLHRWPVIWAAVGLLATVCVFAVGSQGGSVLIPLNGAGIAWAIGPFVLALVIIGWPRLPNRTAAAE